MTDHIAAAISADGYIDVRALSTANLVEHARRIHSTAPTATAALGRVLTAASIIGADIKMPNGSVTLKINGGGPLGSIVAVSDSLGNVRGYVQNPLADPPERPDGKLNVGAAVGNSPDGYLQVIKDLGMAQPYLGRVPLVSGEIAEDITNYFFLSEQTPTVCALGVLIDTDCSVRAAGGFIIRLLPGAPEEVIAFVENAAKSFRPATELFDSGMMPEDVVMSLLPGADMRPLDDARTNIEYKCKCSRDRVATALISMGRDELRSLAEDSSDKPSEITCQFCDASYTFTKTELLGLIGE